MTHVTMTEDHKRMVNAIATLHQGENINSRILNIVEQKGVEESLLWKLVKELVQLGLVEANIYSTYTLSYKGREYFCELNGIDYDEYTRSLEKTASKEERVKRKAGLVDI